MAAFLFYKTLRKAFDHYFYKMNRIVGSILFIIFVQNISFAQIRYERLEVKAKQSFTITGSDILVVDTLIMRDSARIILNPAIRENIINAKVAIIGKGCIIFGKGAAGEQGKVGIIGIRESAPCRNGGNGSDGLNGNVGKDGLNLSLYLGTLKIKGSLIVDLNGGDGGDGGRGGRGGDGGSGTRVCRGGNGGDGGNGGNGSTGGSGGNATIICKTCSDLHLLNGHQLLIKTYGGFAGTGGEGGSGGQSGLGPTQDGRNGKRGIAGSNGVVGKTGIISFEAPAVKAESDNNK